MRTMNRNLLHYEVRTHLEAMSLSFLPSANEEVKVIFSCMSVYPSVSQSVCPLGGGGGKSHVTITFIFIVRNSSCGKVMFL